ncbi:MAG: HEAT repeat domain-containing protein [Acidobacteriota bacterium]
MGEGEAALDVEDVRRKIQLERPLKRRELLESFSSQAGEEIDRLIMSFIDDPSPDVRRAVVAMMRRRGFENKDFYERAAQDHSDAVKRSAEAALKSLDKLRERQQSLSWQVFRRVPTGGAERTKDEGHFSRSLQARDKQTRLEAIQRLGAVETPWANELLLRALTDESWTNRMAAVQILSRRKDLDVEVLHQLLHDQLWFLRASAVEILGRRGDQASTEKMTGLVKDSNVDVRLALAEALGRIGGAAAAKLLEFLLQDPNYTVRVTAQNAMSNIRKRHQEKAQ